MFLDSEQKISEIIHRTNFSIFDISPEKGRQLLEKTEKSSALFLEPDEKTGKISIEMIRDFLQSADSKETSDRFFVILFPETMTPAAENAFLKNLEEPKPFHHFVFFSTEPSALLPTILSRAQLYYFKKIAPLSAPVEASEKIKTLSKRLIVADKKQLIELASEVSKKKDNARAYALDIVGASIEILYKSYFATGQEKFLQKLPNLLRLYDSLSRNGHIKLHFVADML